MARVEVMRRSHAWSAARISFELERDGVHLGRRTVSRILADLH